ncbi:tRNA lysidine(34) synthetase TilS, partial [Candidatus Sumerlaeota bacterium]|nr:tRNA lysidine(34) synthetase TilS [Candidatus Sumerlaeota bacterium]
FVRLLAAQRGLRFGLKNLKGDPSFRLATKGSDKPSEQLLREARYRALDQLAGETGAAVVALGHHRDDLAETVVMHLLRGSGPAGLGGFRPKTDRGRVTYVRPLYECSRAEILEFCRRRGLLWREDRTNRSRRWLRNRVRLDLLPLLEEQYNPRLRDILADNARWFQENEAFFESMARKALGLSRSRQQPPSALSLERLRGMELSVLARVLRIWVMAATGELYPPSGRQIEVLLELIAHPQGKGRVLCAGGVVFYCEGGRLRCERSKSARSAGIAGWVATTSQESKSLPSRAALPLFCLPAARLDLRRYNRDHQPRLFERARRRALDKTNATDLEQYFDADQIEGSLVLRHRRVGDRFRPLGAPGERKLKQFLIDCKVPQEWRDQLLLLCDARGILWVVGVRTGDRARLTAKTTNILRVRVKFERPTRRANR